MSNEAKTVLAFFLGVVIALASPSIASTIKTWSNGSTLTAADLNANFSHIHSTMVGGHGARLVDADVSSSAEITHSKLAGDVALPDMQVTILSSCTVADAGCAVALNQGFTAAVGHAPTMGDYNVHFATRSNNVYGLLTTSHTHGVACSASGFAVDGFTVNCNKTVQDGGVQAADAIFTSILIDDN